MHLWQYMVHRAQEPPHSLVQMELVFWLARKVTWKDGLNTLMVTLIGHHLSMMKLSTDYHRWNVIHCLMSSQPSLKQWKQWNSCHLARLQDQMQYLQRSTKQEVLQWQGNWQSYFTLCGEKKPSLKNSRMQQLSTYSKGKGILKSVTTIEASLYCQLLGRSLLQSYWIDWMNTLNSQGFYQKASVDSGKTEEQ